MQIQRQALSEATKTVTSPPSQWLLLFTVTSLAQSWLTSTNQSCQLSQVSQLRPPVPCQILPFKGFLRDFRTFGPTHACGLETLHLMLVNVLEGDF